MGVFVFAAGIAVLSAKVWSALHRRKKSRQSFLREGIIPGYIPLDKDWIRFLEQSLEREENHPSDDLSRPVTDPSLMNQTEEDAFFKERTGFLTHAVRRSDEFRFWEADYTEASLPNLEKRLLEYQNFPAPYPPSEEKRRQSLSLLHDTAIYVTRTATGSFPSLGHSRNATYSTVIQIMNRLLREPTEDADRQTLLQIHYQLRGPESILSCNDL